MRQRFTVIADIARRRDTERRAAERPLVARPPFQSIQSSGERTDFQRLIQRSFACRCLGIGLKSSDVRKGSRGANKKLRRAASSDRRRATFARREENL